ncbi:hypothetical protein [Epinotia aporema granulovirus]|uniref:Uncharacterized protein n=1 Tax=Epinotia aporema granulovirus TaxID=166056 RepID=K4EQ16_9BBAC|nr:hypothetical protein [Epinotia aporema granulovirus]AER41452.1 hypothetical protein [Epinotia aporema granulovirus]
MSSKQQQFHKLPLADKMATLTYMKSMMIKETARLEKLAKIEKEPTATMDQLKKKRENFLSTFSTML